MAVTSHKTQATELYYANAATTVSKIGQVAGLGAITSPTDEIDVTVLDSTAREYASGFAVPSDLSLPIVFNSGDATHMAMLTLKTSGAVKSWAIMFSEASTAPTAAASAVVVGTARTSIAFSAYVKDVSFEFGINDVVRGTLVLKVSGAIVVTAKI